MYFPGPSSRSCFSSSTAGTGAIIWRGHKGRVKSRTTIFTNWPKSLWSWWPTGHVGYVGHLDRRCDRQWLSRRGRTKYICIQLRDEDCLENCLSNFPTFICMYAIMHPGAHNYTDKSMCTRELVIADAKWCSAYCPPATLLVQNFSPAPWW